MNARDEVNYNGVYWKDIDWDKSIHLLGPDCPFCDGDSVFGHAPKCPYIFENQESPEGREFLRNEIKEALEREKKALENEKIIECALAKEEAKLPDTKNKLPLVTKEILVSVGDEVVVVADETRMCAKVTAISKEGKYITLKCDPIQTIHLFSK